MTVVTANTRRARTVCWPQHFLRVDSLNPCNKPKRQVLCSILILQVCKPRHRAGKHLAPNRRMTKRRARQPGSCPRTRHAGPPNDTVEDTNSPVSKGQPPPHVHEQEGAGRPAQPGRGLPWAPAGVWAHDCHTGFERNQRSGCELNLPIFKSWRVSHAFCKLTQAKQES